MTRHKGSFPKRDGAHRPSGGGRPRGGNRFPRKRKAEDPLPEQAARRKRIEPGQMEYDLATILETQELPDQKELPNAEDGWMDNPKTLFFNGGLSRFAKTSVAVEGGPGANFRTRVTSTMMTGVAVDALGEGPNKRAAEKAAFVHLLCKLHSGGFLKQAVSTQSVDQQTIKEEKDAKVDIYNYAARFGLLPVFSAKTLSSASTRRARGRRKGARSSAVHQTTIELPEQGIHVTGVGRSKEVAEVAAALNFKSEAEKYQSAQGTDSLVVRDSSTLGVANARAFFDFCKNSKIDHRATVETEQKGQGVYAQPVLDGEPLGDRVLLAKKKQAEDVGYLVAALEVVKNEPELLPKFLKALKQGDGRILPNASWVDCSLDSEVADLMHDTIRRARSAGLDDRLADLESHEDDDLERRPLRRQALSPEQVELRSGYLQRQLEQFDSDPELEKLRQTKADLPMNQHGKDVLALLEDNAFSIVIGATGSGKTTQVPQIVLDDAIRKGQGGSCNVICTQPRRIAATSVGRRVAEERAQRLQDSVGYHVRHDAKIPRPGGSIVYCTTGILLQQLQHAPDEILGSVSHLVIDEVHERDILIDFLLIIVKNVLAQRRANGLPCPKVVLMSATMDSDLFSDYFSGLTDENGLSIECPTLRVPGRLFPVTERYLDGILQDLVECHGEGALRPMFRDNDTTDYLEYEKQFARARPYNQVEGDKEEAEDDTVIDWKRKAVTTKDGETSPSTENEDAKVPVGLMATTIAHIAKTTTDGAILAFLPGLDEILGVQKMLIEHRLLGVNITDETRYKTFLLHSSVQDSQREVFNPVPPGCRKIILATNIAETSVTIPDVQYVVDAGKLREKRYDQLTRITKLQCTWVSKSNAKQRAGRAGRVQNGHYFALFTRSRKESLRAVGLPEILRSDLQKVCLDVKAQRFKAPVRQFLADAIEPPTPAAVDRSMDSLIDLDCLTDDEKLTALGRLLASLPVHPSLGKMIVLGAIFRCLDPMLVLGAAAEDRDLFVTPPDRRAAATEAKRSFLRGSESDHIAFLNAFRELRHIHEARGQWAFRDFATQNFLHMGAYRNIVNGAQQIEQVFVEAGLIPKTPAEQRVDWQYGDPELNANSANVDLVKALALAGLQPNIAVRTTPMLLRAPSDPNTLFHPSSVNALSGRDMKKRDQGDQPRPSVRNQLYTYSVMAKSGDGRSTFLRQTTRVTPLMAMLFGSRLQAAAEHRRVLEVDGWLPIVHQGGDARSVLAFRRALERMQADAFRDLASAQPLAEHPVREVFAEAISHILDTTSLRSTGRANGSSRAGDRYQSREDAYSDDEGFDRRGRSEGRGYRSNRNDRGGRSGWDIADFPLDMAQSNSGGGDYYRPARH